eukprot:c22757_g1_i1 orf=178-1800(+)
MAAHLVLHLPIASLHNENCPMGLSRPPAAALHRPREETLQKFPRFAPFLDTCTHTEDKDGYPRGFRTVCHAKKQHQRERVDPFRGDPCVTYDGEIYGIAQGTLNGHEDMCRHGYSKLRQRSSTVYYDKKKKEWLDPFDWGAEPRMINGRFAEEGLQEPEPLKFLPDPDSEYGFLDFPAKFNVEMASLPLLARKDVRKCCCIVAGGVYDNLLFFPVIELLKDRYPGVDIDVFSTERGKQTYEINKHIKRAWVYDVDAAYVVPAEYLEFVGKIKNEYYDMLVSTRLSGFGQSLTLWLTSTRDKIAYVYPDVNAAGAGIFLSDYAEAPRLNLAEGGYHMYAELIEVLKNPQPKVPEMSVRPLSVALSKRLKNFVQQKYMHEEVTQGEFLVFHGIESTSNASMQSKGDLDSLLPLQKWAEIARAASVKCLIVVPNEADKKRVREVLGAGAKVIFITTPGQLAALINDSLGVVTTNTAAVQLACALKKPSVALFSSAEKASLFVPHAKERRCTVVSSDTGKLVDVDAIAAIRAMKTIEEQLLVTA